MSCFLLERRVPSLLPFLRSCFYCASYSYICHLTNKNITAGYCNSLTYIQLITHLHTQKFTNAHAHNTHTRTRIRTRIHSHMYTYTHKAGSSQGIKGKVKQLLGHPGARSARQPSPAGSWRKLLALGQWIPVKGTYRCS